MNQTIEAIYENGVFKPIKANSVKLEAGEQVFITIKTADLNEETNLSLTEKYFKDLSEADIEKVIANALNQSK